MMEAKENNVIPKASKYSPEDIIRLTKDNMYVNTAYPIAPDLWKKYRISKDAAECLDLLCTETGLSFYVHIPFCKNLCKFCEYTRFKYTEEDGEHYVKLITDAIVKYVNTGKKHVSIYGIDIGGGTPTCLTDNQFLRLVQAVQLLKSLGVTAPYYEPSCEFSWQTVTESKAKFLGIAGVHRMSTGIQVITPTLLTDYGRESNPLTFMRKVREMLWANNIEKLNVDIMYGLPGQTKEDILNTLRAIDIINPEQVTVYETRYNNNDIVLHPELVNRDTVFDQYKYVYDYLVNKDYHSTFGSNTFSKSVIDKGLSSYLRSRMHLGVAYKGFGVSAQSMSSQGMAYGPLKNCTNIDALRKLVNLDDEYTYLLPPQELWAKHVSIGMYGGYLNMNNDWKYFKGKELDNVDFRGAVDYLLDNEYLIDLQEWPELPYGYRVTEKGFKHFGSIAAMFWPDEQIDAAVNGISIL